MLCRGEETWLTDGSGRSSCLRDGLRENGNHAMGDKVDSLWAYLVVLAFVRLMFPFFDNHSNQSKDHTYKGP